MSESSRTRRPVLTLLVLAVGLTGVIGFVAFAALLVAHISRQRTEAEAASTEPAVPPPDLVGFTHIADPVERRRLRLEAAIAREGLTGVLVVNQALPPDAQISERAELLLVGHVSPTGYARLHMVVNELYPLREYLQIEWRVEADWSFQPPGKLLTGLTDPTPVKDGKPGGSVYHPLRTGETWKYDGIQPSPTQTYSSRTTVEAPEVMNGRRVVPVLTAVAGETKRELLTEEGNGVFRVKYGDTDLPAPVPFLPHPMPARFERWTITATVAGSISTVTVMSLGERDVTVPAGTFKAVCLWWSARVTAGPGRGLHQQSLRWYAANVGMVKSVAFGGESEVVMNLAEHVKGK